MEAARRRDVKFTYRDYMSLQDDKRYELIEGELYLTPAPNEAHQRISGNLEFRLRLYLESHPGWVLYRAPFDIVLSEHNVVQPDIILIPEKRKSIIKAQNVKGSPDICIEILSPGTLDRDLDMKRRLYLKSGVLEYWIVDPEAQTVEVLCAGKEEFEQYRVFKPGIPLSTPFLPDLDLDLGKVFCP